MTPTSPNQTLDQTITFLRQNPLTNLDILEPLRLGTAEIVAAEPQGILIGLGTTHLLSARDTETALRLCAAAKKLDSVLAHQLDTVPALIDKYGFEVDMTVYQAAMFITQPLPLPQVAGVELRTLGTEYTDAVHTYYKAHAPRGYVQGRLAAGVMLGAFADGELAGFAGEHEEDAMGLLEVLPAYRRAGIGRLLSVAIINRRLAQGKVPYGQIETDNATSLAMQRAMGYAIGEDKLTWLSLPPAQ